MGSNHLFYVHKWLSDRVLRVRELYPESPLYRRARKLRQQGEKIIDLTGNCINDPPAAVYEAIKRELPTGFPSPELRGLKTLRQALAEVEAKDTGREVDPDSQIIVFGGGGMQALNLTIQSTVNPEDEVVILTPCFATDEMVKLSGGTPVFVRLKEVEGYKPDLNRLSESITPKTKMIANKYLIKQVEKIFLWNAEFAPPITQVGVEAAIRNSKEWMKDQIDGMKRKRDILYSGLTKIDGFKIHKPLGGPTMFPDISHFEKDSMKFAYYLLENAKVLVPPGIFYMGEGHIRMAFWGSGKVLTEEEMHEVVDRFRELVPKYDYSKYSMPDV